MGPKKAKNKLKVSGPKPVTTNTTPKSGTQQAPVKKKKKKNDPLKPQPAWLFPPDEENPILNPKNKSKEQIQKEVDERLAAIRFLEHKSVTAPVKTAPPVELLQLIGAFFASYGFVSTGRIFSLERNARKKIDGWNDVNGTKRFSKDMPDLVKIFKDWRADWEGESDAETSSSGEESEEDVEMKDVASGSDSSDSEGESDSGKEERLAPKTNGVKIRTKLTGSAAGGQSKGAKTKAASSSSSEDKDESGENEKAPTGTNPATASSSSSSSEAASAKEKKTTKKAVQIENKKKHSSKNSASSSVSDSDSGANSDEERATKFLDDMRKSKQPALTEVAKAGSDSSETLKGNSPTKQLSPSVSSSESESSSTDSESDSATHTKSTTNPTAGIPKSSKRKASSSSPADEEALDTPADESSTNITTTEQPSKRVRVANEPFSRIPKDTKVDPRLSSNKYIPYDYAQQAHEDLSVTKGKGFTKEKNKKKKGA